MFLVCLNKVLCKTGEMKAFVLPGDMNSVILTLNPQPLGWRKGVDVLGVEGRREGNLKKKKRVTPSWEPVTSLRSSDILR